jgi:hypothetical protein
MRTSNPAKREKTAYFHQLQSELRDRWQSIDLFDQDDRDILVIPSLSLDQRQLKKIDGHLHYEERLLFSLIRLRNPYTRLIYVTSQPLAPVIIDYYLQLLPGIPFSHARDRLLLFSTHDTSLKPLTQKVLERPRLIERIRKAMRPHKSYMVCFNSTVLEQELSLKLDLPLLACSPELLYWGTKSGSREVFAEAQIPYPDGTPSAWDERELLEAGADLWERNPQLQRMVIKLNEGFSGEGNALLDLRPIQDKQTRPERIQALRDRLPHLRFQSDSETWEGFSSRIADLGAIVEAFVEGEEKRSPSFQGYLTPDGNVHILSTHDQILGGPNGQIYFGCRFPADAAYRLRLQEMGVKVGKILASKGALERYGVDFIAVRHPERQTWDIQAIEINLRKGGTTHPFMALKLLTNGQCDPSTGLLYCQQGRPKFYTASDNLQKPQYRGLLPSDLMDIITCHRLHFDSSTMTGTVFHLIGALSEFGKVGLTSIGNTIEEAESIRDRVEAILDRETDAIASNTAATPSLPITWLGRDG